MLAQWIGEVVGEMHRHKISKSRLAEHLGVTREYVSAILNGHVEPAGAEAKCRRAVAELVELTATE